MIHSRENVTKALVDVSKETGLDVNGDKLKYMVMFRQHIAGQNHGIMFDNKSYENLEQLKYLGSKLKN